MNDFKNKRVIVTGAASGIGKAVAEQFLAHGALVGLIDRNEEELQEFLADYDAQTHYRAVDVTEAEKLQEAMSGLVEELGGLDVLHVNAGINGTWTPIEELTVAEWDQTINTNLRSTFITVKAAIPFMKANGGSIVITSSVNGNRIFSNFGATAYSTSKAGQVAFTKMAALELSGYNIRVNAICPGAARNLGVEEIRSLSQWATGGLQPDVTLLLDLPPEVAARRRPGRPGEPDRMERESMDFHERVRHQYLRLADAEPERIAVIDAVGTAEEVFREIRGVLEERCGDFLREASRKDDASEGGSPAAAGVDEVRLPAAGVAGEAGEVKTQERASSDGRGKSRRGGRAGKVSASQAGNGRGNARGNANRAAQVPLWDNAEDGVLL